MREIEPDHAAALLCERRDSLDVEQLTGEKVDAADHDDRDLLSAFLQRSFDIFLSNCELTFTRSRKNERVFRIESVMNDLRFDRIRIGRESRLYTSNIETRFRRPVL